LVTAVPFLSNFLAEARHLPRGRHRAGDRHLKFHETWDNLVWCPRQDSNLRHTV
jgi:hypothetical protein